MGMISQPIVAAIVVAVFIQIPTYWQLNGQLNPFKRSLGLFANFFGFIVSYLSNIWWRARF